jgi:hypothetical protein
MADANPVAVVDEAEETLRRAALATGDEAIALHEAVLDSATAASKQRETSILALAGLYAQLGQADKLSALLERAKPLFAELPKARTAKVVRTLIDHVAAVPRDTLELQEKLCADCIAWSDAENRRCVLRGAEVCDAGDRAVQHMLNATHEDLPALANCCLPCAWLAVDRA